MNGRLFRFTGSDLVYGQSMELDQLLATLSVDLTIDLVIAHESTESMLHTLPTVDVYTESHRIVLSTYLGLSMPCDVSAPTRVIRNR